MQMNFQKYIYALKFPVLPVHAEILPEISIEYLNTSESSLTLS